MHWTGPFSEGLAAVSLFECPYFGPFAYVACTLLGCGYVDRTGRQVIEPRLSYAGQFCHGLAVAGSGNRYGLINKTGTFVADDRYEGVGGSIGGLKVPASCPFHEGLAPVEQQGRWGFVDTQGRQVIAPQFENAMPFSEGLAEVLQGGKWGFIDRTGTIVVEPQFESTGSFAEGLASVKVQGRWGAIDRTGKMVIPPRFDPLHEFSEGLAMIRLDEKWGFVDRSGTIVIAPQFKDARSFRGGLAPVCMAEGPQIPGDEYHTAACERQGPSYIDATGHVVWKSAGSSTVN